LRTFVILKNSIFWDVTPCSMLKVNRRFGGICSFHFHGRRIHQARNKHEAVNKQRVCLAYYSTLKMEEAYYPESSVNFQQASRQYIPEHRTLHNHRCKNLKYCLPNSFFISSLLILSKRLCGRERKLLAGSL
jgi:hypothetical protein